MKWSANRLNTATSCPKKMTFYNQTSLHNIYENWNCKKKFWFVFCNFFPNFHKIKKKFNRWKKWSDLTIIGTMAWMIGYNHKQSYFGKQNIYFPEVKIIFKREKMTWNGRSGDTPPKREAPAENGRVDRSVNIIFMIIKNKMLRSFNYQLWLKWCGLWVVKCVVRGPKGPQSKMATWRSDAQN